jgi:hypothetical protein
MHVLRILFLLYVFFFKTALLLDIFINICTCIYRDTSTIKRTVSLLTAHKLSIAEMVEVMIIYVYLCLYVYKYIYI